MCQVERHPEEIRQRELAVSLSARYPTRPCRIYHTESGHFWLRFDRKPLSEVQAQQVVLVATYINGKEVNGTDSR